jgi:hypothetical protein
MKGLNKLLVHKRTLPNRWETMVVVQNCELFESLLISDFIMDTNWPYNGFVMDTNWRNNCNSLGQRSSTRVMSQATKDLVRGIWNLDNWKSESILSFGFAIGLVPPPKKSQCKTHTFSKQIVNKKRQSGFVNNQIIDMNAICIVNTWYLYSTPFHSTLGSGQT